MSRDSAVSVKIFDQTYRLAASRDRDADYIQRAAAYLDEKMREAAQHAGHRAPLDIAILAALDIAEEVIAERDKKERLLDQTDAQIDSFTKKLNDEGLDTDGEPSPSPRF
jgi:cell division protein ZapA (FtsZ GTPase activity inhibitor)